MCGICGLVYRDPRRIPEEDRLRRMAQTIRHRGPDDEGVLVAGSAGLAHRRLTIIDLSSAGHQPMSNEDGTVWIVYNGEVYNFPELREALRQPHQFRSHTDTEVLIHLYEEVGESMVDRLDGMFAFAILDTKRQRLFLARDPFGIKPLYYSWNAERFVFGSEIKPLLASGEVARDVDPAALNDYFDFHWIPAPRSIFREVRKLPHAHTLSIDLNRWEHQVRRYWRPQYQPETGRSAESWSDEIAETLNRSVRSQLISDVPLGTFLSGGIDSSLVTYYAAKNTSGRLKTFTIDFQESGASEGEHARFIAQQLQTDAVFRTLTEDSLANLASLAEYYDEPFADSSLLPTCAVSRVARESVTVTLSGDGGDELFTGYRSHQMAHRISRLDYLPTFLTAGLFGTLAALTGPDTRLHEWSRRFALPPTRRRASLLRLPGRSIRLDKLAPELREPTEARFWHLDQYENELRGVPPITQAQFYDMLLYLPNDILVKVDRASMASSLEARVPVLSRPIAELAFRIPESIRFDRQLQKPLLRRLVARHFGDRLARLPKHGFSIPQSRWMATAASPQQEAELLAGGAVRQGGLSADGIRRLFASIRHGSGRWRTDRTEELFALLVFHHWWNRYLA